MSDRKSFLLIVLMAGMWLLVPLVAQFEQNFVPQLHGYVDPTPPPVFSRKTWINGEFQRQFETNLNDSLPFRNLFIRIRNQIDFSLFKVLNANRMVYGEDAYLFSEQYIHSATGQDFAGKDKLDKKIRDLKLVQDRLWNERGIMMVLVLCPNKTDYYAELLPPRYRIQYDHRKQTNLEYIAKQCRITGVRVVDFSSWFPAMKKKSLYPLIPKSGIHWSYYGAYLAGDSLSRFLSNESKTPLPKLILDSLHESYAPIAEDGDMCATLNLLWKIPGPPLGYPSFHGSFTDGQPKPSALFIGDSFYWNWYGSGLIQTLFGNQDFWYYGKDVYPAVNGHPAALADIDAAPVILKQKFIVLLQGNLVNGDVGFGFPEVFFSALDPENSRLLKLERQMRSNTEWFEDIKRKAAKNNLSVDEQLRLDALWIINNERQTSLKN